MNKTEKFNTYAALIEGLDVTFYCFNSTRVEFKDFVKIQNNGYSNAIQKQYKIFYRFESATLNDMISLSLN